MLAYLSDLGRFFCSSLQLPVRPKNMSQDVPHWSRSRWEEDRSCSWACPGSQKPQLAGPAVHSRPAHLASCLVLFSVYGLGMAGP